MEIRKRRKFSKEFKTDVVNMIKFGAKSVRKLSAELEIHEVLIYNWVKMYDQEKRKHFREKEIKKDLMFLSV